MLAKTATSMTEEQSSSAEGLLFTRTGGDGLAWAEGLLFMRTGGDGIVSAEDLLFISMRTGGDSLKVKSCNPTPATTGHHTKGKIAPRLQVDSPILATRDDPVTANEAKNHFEMHR